MSSTLENSSLIDKVEYFDQLLLKIMDEMNLDRNEFDHLRNISIMVIDILDSNPTYYHKNISDPELFSFLVNNIHERMMKNITNKSNILSREPSFIVGKSSATNSQN